MPQALDCLHRRIGRITDEPAQRPGSAEAATDPMLGVAFISAARQTVLPGQRHKHSRANRQFAPPQHANRV
jgi:hypothetical protein